MSEEEQSEKKTGGIKRCPGCRSINPTGSEVCFKCGKVL